VIKASVEADRPMDVGETRATVQKLLGHPVSRDSVNWRREHSYATPSKGFVLDATHVPGPEVYALSNSQYDGPFSCGRPNAHGRRQ